METALGLLELNSIARSIVVLDRIIKKATIEVIESSTICPGKYMIIFHGGVGEVEASYIEGREIAGHMLVDHLFLPHQ
jgi:microcompartment protein CcmL/EutN